MTANNQNPCCSGGSQSDAASANHEAVDTKNGDQTRAQVSQNYAEALKRTQQSAEDAPAKSCCGGGPAPEATVAQLAGYGLMMDDDLGSAAQSSFGCGNPLAFQDVQPGQTVLDLGSGAGLDLLIAAKKVGFEGKVIGVDMTDEMLDAARANAEKAGATQVELRKGVIEQLPVEDRSVDWVISNCVINLSTDKPAVFREVARVLAPGGRFAVSDIVVEELPDSLRQHAVAYSACIGGAISEADYIGGLEVAGLSDVKVTERMVYTHEQLAGILTCDFGLDDAAVAELGEALKSVEGKVWSAKFSGVRN
jgi:arsenite methyltransferase